MSGTLEIPRCDGRIRALHLHGEKDTAVPFDGEEYSERLQAFLRAVPTIPAASRGSDIEIRKVRGYGHRWTEAGDPFDATQEFWRFARMAPGA
jgi:poly(3-hydroxybutyrate) depolymerase